MQSINMTTTGVIIIACGIVLLAWEIVAFVLQKRRALLSTWLQKAGFRSPAIVFILGMIAGHVWCYFPPTLDGEKFHCPNCRHECELIVNVDGTLTAVETDN